MIDPSVMRLHALHKDLQLGIGAEWSTLPHVLGSLHLRAAIGLGMEKASVCSLMHELAHGSPRRGGVIR